MLCFSAYIGRQVNQFFCVCMYDRDGLEVTFTLLPCKYYCSEHGCTNSGFCFQFIQVHNTDIEHLHLTKNIFFTYQYIVSSSFRCQQLCPMDPIQTLSHCKLLICLSVFKWLNIKRTEILWKTNVMNNSNFIFLSIALEHDHAHLPSCYKSLG